MPKSRNTENLLLKLRASLCHKWYNCTGFLVLPELTINEDLSYAEEGTKAHKILEDLLLMKQIEGHEEIKNCASYILSKSTTDSSMYIEKKVYLHHIHPNLSGTLDCVIVSPKDKMIHLFDLKYGAYREVEAENNLQLLFYLSGIKNNLNLHSQYKAVFYILQPRSKEGRYIKTWSPTLTVLREFEYEIRNIVYDVLNGITKEKVGSHCEYCKSKIFCNTFKKQVKNTSVLVDNLSLTELEELYLLNKPIEKLFHDVKMTLGYLLRADEAVLSKFDVSSGRKILKWRNTSKIEKLVSHIPHAFDVISPARFIKSCFYESLDTELKEKIQNEIETYYSEFVLKRKPVKRSSKK